MIDTAAWRRLGAACAATLAVLACGCRGDEPKAAKPEETAAVEPASPPSGEAESLAVEPEVDEQSGLEVRFGLRTDGERAIAEPVLSFGGGDRVCLAVSLASAAPGGELGLRWYDAAGEPVGELEATLAGSPPAAARCLPGSEKLALGSYSVEVDLSGEAVGGASFTVADARELPRRGGA